MCGREEGKANAAAALENVAADNDKNLVAIAAAGGILPLIALSCSGTAEDKANAAGALRSVAVNDENQVAIAAAGGIPPLVALLSLALAHI